MNDSTGEGYKASDITVIVNGNNQSPDSFQGSETGTEVRLGFGTYAIGAGGPENKNPSLPYPLIRIISSSGCGGTIHLDETKTCTITVALSPS